MTGRGFQVTLLGCLPNGVLSMRGGSRRSFLAAAGAVASSGLAGCTGLQVGGPVASADAERLLVFHAGSLAAPFAAAEPGFESATGIDVQREARGSVASTKKLTEQGRRPDVLGVSDYRLLRDRVLPAFADWYAIFSTNAMAIQYRPDAPGADDITTDTWWEVLARDDVTIGHSDPALDPGGYRAVMAMQLGAIDFEGTRLYDDATYERLRANSVVSTDTEANLKGQLEAGELDYALYYRSLCTTADLPYVDLQPAVDLSRATSEYADHYAAATVETRTGTYVGAPIAYGITVPTAARSPTAGDRWVEHLATDAGRAALTGAGLDPITPLVVPANSADAVPGRLRPHTETRDTLGPLAL